MEHYYCYILFSSSLDRYYIGSTILEPKERLTRHLFSYYGNQKFTASAKDWEIFLEISCSSIEQARKIERHIKSMKSKIYINNLKKYPEMIEKQIAKNSKND